MPLIAQPDQRSRRLIEAAFESDGKGGIEIAFDLERLREIRFQHTDMAEQYGVPLRASGLVVKVDERLAFPVPVSRAIGEGDQDARAGRASEPGQDTFQQSGHGGVSG